MQIPRRLLPSLSLLSAFEAAARTQSISAAARELNLTQSAVSRQIKALEAQLGAQLFIRERQTIRLTLGGDSYARDIRDALRRISMASLNFRANPAGGTLNVAVVPTFGARWIAPRLAGFVAAHPDVMLNFTSVQGKPDFRAEPTDIAICLGRPLADELETSPLLSEILLPVCAPVVKTQFGFAEAADIRKAPLLILKSRPDAWERWLMAHAAPAEDVHGMMFDQFNTIIEAAIAGIGVALVPALLVTDELSAGKLVTAGPWPFGSDQKYYLAWPTERSSYPPLIAFRDWIESFAVGPPAEGLAPPC